MSSLLTFRNGIYGGHGMWYYTGKAIGNDNVANIIFIEAARFVGRISGWMFIEIQIENYENQEPGLPVNLHRIQKYKIPNLILRHTLQHEVREQ